jgi:hypothetical protein
MPQVLQIWIGIKHSSIAGDGRIFSRGSTRELPRVAGELKQHQFFVLSVSAPFLIIEIAQARSRT